LPFLMTRVILLRKERQNDEYREVLEGSGYEVEFIKTLDFEFINQKSLEERLTHFSAIIATSQTSLEAISNLGENRWCGKHSYVVGVKSAQIGEAMGFTVSGENCGSAAALGDFLAAEHDKSIPILYLTGSRNNLELCQKLKDLEFVFEEIMVYKTINMPVSTNLDGGVLVFFSPSGLDSLPSKMGNCSAVAIGKTTGKALADRGIKCSIASSPTPQGILEAVENLVHQNLFE
jgi:uroporphyrinogen-III synthase